ncbi:MAG: histidine phosphatase family protein [Chitinophagales bacterium]
MKQLFLVRHAKSSWKDASLDDHDRPLGKRGKRDAPFMAKILLDKKIKVDQIVSSTALRALSTAKEFAKKLDIKKGKIVTVAELYGAELNKLLDYIKSTDDSYNSLMLFGHNPEITALTNYLTEANIDNIPTCGIAAVDFEITHWSGIGAAEGKLRFFEYPKLHLKDSPE